MIEHSRVRHLLYAFTAAAVVVALVVLALMSYRGDFQNTKTVYLNAPRAGLLLLPGSDVKLHGVVVGRVSEVTVADEKARIRMEIDSGVTGELPTNVLAEMEPTTLFGRKYVALSIPSAPAAGRLTEGSTIDTSKTPVEVFDTFDLLVKILNRVDPARVNATLAAVQTGTVDRGGKLGAVIDDVNRYLATFNGSLPTLQRDLRLGADNLETFAAMTPDLMTTVRNLTVTSKTVVDEQTELTAFLLSFTRFGNTGDRFLTGAGTPLVKAAEALAPPTQVLGDYGPILPCFLSGLNLGRKYLERAFGGARAGLDIVGTLIMGDPPYRPGVDAPRTNAGASGPSCYGYPRGPGAKAPGHVDFDDGSHAYRDVKTPEDVIGNPFASMIYGMTR
ncbi:MULTISPECIES: MCE family protein [Gordonia]|uniref:Mce family protein n=2 Tax=Gordonia TaxID=2053 RepID=L7LN06_9ACTN|nr:MULTISPECIES: MCE family protein [Gordonia]ADG96487.1 MceA [Gordonia cholesterolivorans]AUH67636.1 MCE family protein [Gordonia sp. YC-JH1]MBY4568747.1 mammalian cell entry protein [Gordonia sihwensis]GAC61467.1 Mce family protein [Gordonia sihwensis NBRC 108236]